ncbi:hypothetical protein [Streptomyces sp. 3N207]|uniref:hypothetical protein n=1 Tax=Streptomyces sp. 3N207 TaxID=3457417 RepID=UPI003FD3B257
MRLLAQGAADGLNNVHGAAAHIREQDTVQPAPAGDVRALPEQAAGGQNAELGLAPFGIDAVRELVEHGPLVRGRVQAAQPLPPHLARKPPRRAQLVGRVRQATGEGEGFLGTGVERQEAHDARGLHVGQGGGPDGTQPHAAPLLQRRLVTRGCGVANLQHVDLEGGQQALLDGLPQGEGERGLAEHALVVHRGDQHLATDGVRLIDPGRGRHVQAPVGRNAGVVVDDGPRFRGQAGGAVRLVHDRQTKAVQLLPERTRQGALQDAGDRAFLRSLVVALVVLVLVGGGAARVTDQRGVMANTVTGPVPAHSANRSGFVVHRTPKSSARWARTSESRFREQTATALPRMPY